MHDRRIVAHPTRGDVAHGRRRHQAGRRGDHREEVAETLVRRRPSGDLDDKPIELRRELGMIHHGRRREIQGEARRQLRFGKPIAQFLQPIERFRRLAGDVVAVEKRGENSRRSIGLFVFHSLCLSQPLFSRERGPVVFESEQPQNQVCPPAIGRRPQRGQILGDVGFPVRRVASAPCESGDQRAWRECAFRCLAHKRAAVGLERERPLGGRQPDIPDFAAVRQRQVSDEPPAIPRHGRPRTERRRDSFVEHAQHDVEPIAPSEPLILGVGRIRLGCDGDRFTPARRRRIDRHLRTGVKFR